MLYKTKVTRYICAIRCGIHRGGYNKNNTVMTPQIHGITTPWVETNMQVLCEIGNNTVQQFDRLSHCQIVPVANIPQPVCASPYTPIPTLSSMGIGYEYQFVSVSVQRNRCTDGHTCCYDAVLSFDLQGGVNIFLNFRTKTRLQ